METVGTCSHGSNCKRCTKMKLCSDVNCDFCFQKSFSSHPKSEFWSDKNALRPREVFKGTGKKFWFDCPDCSHSFEKEAKTITGPRREWCPFCLGNKLCETNCQHCSQKSFSSFDKEKVGCWDYEKNTVSPRQISKSSQKKYWFNCGECHHPFEASPDHISSKNGRWCPYCSNKKLCLADCHTCFKKSFASHPKSLFWSKKNQNNPREVFRNTYKKYLFDCEKCKKEFPTTPASIVSQDSWCPNCCWSKGEKKVSEVLKTKGIAYQREKKFKGLVYKISLRYDFYFVLEGKKCVIEYDGKQHFEKGHFWTKEKDRKEKDLVKTKFCYTGGFNLLRIPYTHLGKIPDVLEKFICDVKESNAPIFRFRNKKLYSEHFSLLE